MPDDFPNAVYAGTLRLGDIALPCYILEDGQRVFPLDAVQQALGCTAEEFAQLLATLDQADVFRVIPRDPR